jgi:murein DD-endopeptidase MepM/ murein hydrolase activator NlpD
VQAALWLWGVAVWAGDFTLICQPPQPVNGSPVWLQVKTPLVLKSVTLKLGTRELPLRFDAASATWWGLGGIDYDTKPGPLAVAIDGLGVDGTPHTGTAPLVVAKGLYPVSRLQVPPQFVKPPADVLKRIEQERAIKKKIFSASAPEALGRGPFARPVSNATSGVYGSQRTYNNVRRSVHYGLDFRSATGSPVVAVQDGVVVLARGFYYEGGFVVLDHGQGWYSLYMHLSEFVAQEGERVKRGQLIAKSGGTGQSTGPHLHLGLQWRGIYVNPAPLLDWRLPE